MNERTVTEDDVRAEHSSSANQTAHWVYLAAVLLGGTLLMLVLIAALGAAGT